MWYHHGGTSTTVLHNPANTAYPGSNFSFIFDAVNQFSSEKDAHTMWWIPENNTEQGHNLLHILKQQLK